VIHVMTDAELRRKTWQGTVPSTPWICSQLAGAQHLSFSYLLVCCLLCQVAHVDGQQRLQRGRPG
jgi:hypothetical protein